MAIIFNWKNYTESKKDIENLVSYLNKTSFNESAIIAPSDIDLEYLSKNINNKKLSLSSQTVQYSKETPETGSSNVLRLKELGVDYAIIGHQERRLSGETNDIVIEKIKNCLNNNITPIICIGDKSYNNNSDSYMNQLSCILEKVDNKMLSNSIFAYEPSSSIGGDGPSSNASIEKEIKNIKDILMSKSIKSSVIYGGSVNGDNAREIINNTDADGVLIGRASLKIDDINKILK